MATRPKAVIESRNGEKFSPITIAKNVLTDDGQNLHDILSDRKEDTMTPTIENSSSMFKVGQGDNVDYSENVVDGAYESLVLKGKSLVNLSNLHKSFNDVTLSDYYVDTSLCETSKLKLGIPYTLVFYTTVHGGDHDIYNTIELGVSNSLHSTNAHPKTATNHRGTLVKNGWSKVCVTFTDFLGYKYLSLRPIRCNAPESGKSIRFSIEGFILLEGDWSNKDLPFNDYFEGICDVKMPILRNVGKNLFDVGKVINLAPNKIKLVDEGIEVINGIYDLTSALNINPDKQYTVGYSFERISGVGRALFAFKYEDGSIQYINGSENGRLSTTSHKGKKIKRFELTYSDNGVTRLRKIQLEESSSETTYEEHKTNILRTSEEIVLRSLPSGVCDTLNVETGEYVQRVGEVVLDGSEENIIHDGISCNWVLEKVKNMSATFYSRIIINNSIGNDKKPGCIITNTFREIPYVFNLIDGEQEGINNSSLNILRVNISKQRLSSVDVNGFKQYLSQNPITVQYELATPIVTTIDIQGFPYAYENGHVQLSSGSIEQSLTPKVEYSVTTNRNGQIRSNQKMVERHQKQLDHLQAMILTNLVNTQYEQTLTNLKYDLKNVREEVK